MPRNVDPLEWDDDLYQDEPHFENEINDDDDKEGERPFNAELIRVDSVPITIDHMQRLIEKKKLNLNPDFQRRKVWTEVKRKSLLIESIMLRIPIPVFYVYEDEEGVWHVVDGLQRLSTIYDFIKDRYSLKGLQYLKNLEGLTFSDLERDYPKYYNRIMNNVKLTMNVIDATTPPQVKYDIFRRINTGGMPLNAQEIRNSTAKENVREFLQRLASNDTFLKSTNNMKDLRMQAQELVLRFVAFYRAYNFEERSLTKYRGSMDVFLDETFDDINQMKNRHLEKYSHAFMNGVQISYYLFNRWAFRRVSKENNWRKNPVNKSLFTCLMVILSYYDYEDIKRRFDRNNLTVLYKLGVRFDEDLDFSEAFSRGTTHVNQVKIQFEQIRQFIWEELGTC